mmetsp:Transcript_104964/g.182451  ORF Transcript_104964/g.182451 Transcript_104964/m.182451 type:complete len:137 (+) Transcript_104964:624-1034(+)
MFGRPKGLLCLEIVGLAATYLKAVIDTLLEQLASLDLAREGATWGGATYLRAVTGVTGSSPERLRCLDIPGLTAKVWKASTGTSPERLLCLDTAEVVATYLRAAGIESTSSYNKVLLAMFGSYTNQGTLSTDVKWA